MFRSFKTFFVGFTTVNDITYPLVTQTILTNGKEFYFYVYQLNTILLFNKNATDNPKRNLCWASGSQKLYEEVKEGKVVGLNDEVVKMLVKLYLNEPQDRLGVNLRPLLSEQEKLAADYEVSNFFYMILLNFDLVVVIRTTIKGNGWKRNINI